MSVIHASACILGSRGVVVRGASGSGKSLLVRQLVEAASQRGDFGIWVADDQVDLTARNGALMARPVATIAGQAELRFKGVLPTKHAAGTRLDLIVDLKPESELERLPETGFATLEGVSLPRICVPQENLEHARSIVEAELLSSSDQITS
ncbi:MAG: hypothetical protein AAFO70_00830 [Pseudomonadota bacterium]